MNIPLFSLECGLIDKFIVIRFLNIEKRFILLSSFQKVIK